MPYANAVKATMLRSVFGATEPAPKPATIAVALSSAEPVADPATGVFSGWVEPSTGGYARQMLANDDVSFTVDDTGIARVAVMVDWGTVTGTAYDVQPSFVVFLDDTNTCLGYGQLSAAVAGAVGDAVFADPNTLVFELL